MGKYIMLATMVVSICVCASRAMVDASKKSGEGKYISAIMLFMSAWASVLAGSTLACIVVYRIEVAP